MIDLKELRVGNIVLYTEDNDELPVLKIDGDSKTVCLDLLLGLNMELNEQDIDPIPLTPEWLERCGYEYSKPDEKWYKKGSPLGPIYHIYNGAYGIQGLGTHPGSNLKYLHQLQNLYLDLTGEELQIKNI